MTLIRSKITCCLYNFDNSYNHNDDYVCYVTAAIFADDDDSAIIVIIIMMMMKG